MFKIFVLMILMFHQTLPVPAKAGGEKGSLQFGLTDKRGVISRHLGHGLTLRVVKDKSITQTDFGWIVEVKKLPYDSNSKNLIYQNPTGSTADASQFYAWQIGNPEFPVSRSLEVEGYPLTIRISLRNAKAEGTDVDTRFVSGKLKITWEWKSLPQTTRADSE